MTKPQGLGAESARIEGDSLVIEMHSGVSATIPRAIIPVAAISKAPAKKLQRIEVGKLGDHVWFPDIEEGYSVAGLLDAAFGAAIRMRLARSGGRKSTAAKRAASKANGALGGRPRKKPDS